MRRSFGPKMGGGSGGGAGGGWMMKTVHRAVRAGMGSGEPYTHAPTRTTGNRNQSPNTTLSLTPNTNPSSPCSYLNHPAPETPRAFTAASEEFDWEYIDGDGGSSTSVQGGFYDDLLFGGVPSEEEVHRALSSLHEVLEPVSFAQLMNRGTSRIGDEDGVETSSSPTGFRRDGFELDWTEPSMQLCYSTSALQGPSSDKVFDAFHLLQNEPSVQRMVISLSSDKAVWDAVMNNEVVRELRESVQEDKNIYDGLEDDEDDSNPVTKVLRWIFANTKDRVIEIVEKITMVVNELIRPMSKGEKPKGGLDSFDEKLRTSFFLSIVVLLIVVMGRSGKS